MDVMNISRTKLELEVPTKLPLFMELEHSTIWLEVPTKPPYRKLEDSTVCLEEELQKQDLQNLNLGYTHW